jgi:hypothetical protein
MPGMRTERLDNSRIIRSFSEQTHGSSGRWGIPELIGLMPESQNATAVDQKPTEIPSGLMINPPEGFAAIVA